MENLIIETREDYASPGGISLRSTSFALSSAYFALVLFKIIPESTSVFISDLVTLFLVIFGALGFIGFLWEGFVNKISYEPESNPQDLQTPNILTFSMGLLLFICIFAPFTLTILCMSGYLIESKSYIQVISYLSAVLIGYLFQKCV